MIAAGHAHVRTRVNGSGEDRVLVTEYLIQGEPYRIEVRRAINPLANIRNVDIVNARTQQTWKEEYYWGLGLCRIKSILENDSYEGKPVIAYRAWQDCDGNIHPVRIFNGQIPEWTPGDEAMNLTLRTQADWPSIVLWIRGVTSEGRRRDPAYGAHNWAWDGPYRGTPQDSPAGNPETSEAHAVDGRWILESAGPGVQGQPTEVDGRTHFVNLELYDAIAG
jgi:hypothetical protein